QAEDGIRDFHVTGVQTCALPILTTRHPSDWSLGRIRAASSLLDRIGRCHLGAKFEALPAPLRRPEVFSARGIATSLQKASLQPRSEERRVGKECRPRRWTEHGSE